jgi:hypothetical protein
VGNELKRFEFIAYFVGAYVADVIFKSGREEMSPEEIAMIVDRALDNLRGRDGEARGDSAPELTGMPASTKPEPNAG